MNIIIESSLHNLKKAKILLSKLDNDILNNASIAPYYSTIGSHIRHILDFYDGIFNIDSDKVIDLTARTRNKLVENYCNCALGYLNDIMGKLRSFDENLEIQVIVKDDLGMGIIEIPYTLAAIFSQANSHTIHHYAIINYILHGLNFQLEDESFGYNPTTAIEVSK